MPIWRQPWSHVGWLAGAISASAAAGSMRSLCRPRPPPAFFANLRPVISIRPDPFLREPFQCTHTVWGKKGFYRHGGYHPNSRVERKGSRHGGLKKQVRGLKKKGSREGGVRKKGAGVKKERSRVRKEGLGVKKKGVG